MTFSDSQLRQTYIAQGEYAVSGDYDQVITTVLGSCVSTCIWDPDAGAGGMNHILVASHGSGSSRTDFAGVNAMELVINDLIKLGAMRRNLRAKVFGGARMIAGLSDIGQANAEFALDFLKREGIACVGSSVGGVSARQVKFFPATGRVLVRTVYDKVAIPVETPARPVAGNDVELF